MYFDTPARQVCAVKVAKTNTPLHALVMMNDVTYIEAARVLAQNILKAETVPEKRLNLAFRKATGRHPTPQESAILQKVLQKLRNRYRKNIKGAGNLIQVGETPVPEKIDAVELAAYTGVMNLILNLDEVVTKE